MKRILFILLLTLAVPCYGQRFVKSVPTLTALLQQNPLDIQSNVWTMGYTTPLDGGGGHWHPAPASGVATNKGTLIVSPVNTNYVWVREYFGTINVQWFGAKGSNAVDDGPAIQDALNAATTGQTVFFPAPDSAYYTDRTLVITNQIKILGDQSRVRLFSFSSLFNVSGSSNMFLVDVPNVTFDGMILDGNSIGNWYLVGPTTHYAGTPGYQVRLLQIGQSQAVSNIVVQNCTFYNSPFLGISAGNYGIGQSFDIACNNNTFYYCQGVQLTATHVTRLQANNNRFIQPYFFPFQPYEACTNVAFNNNYVYYNVSELNTNHIEDFINGTGDVYGRTQIGKLDPGWIPIDQVAMSGNTMQGAMVTLGNTVGNITFSDNKIFKSPYAGLSSRATNGPVVISGNTIVECVGPGMEIAPNTNLVQVLGNTLTGNHTSANDNFYGGHLTACNIWFSGDGVVSQPWVMARNNVIKQLNGKPKYGVNLDPTVQGALIYYEGNQDYNGGATANVYDSGNNFWNGFRAVGAGQPFRVVGSAPSVDINDMTSSNPFWSLSRGNTNYWYGYDDNTDDSFILTGRTANGVDVMHANQTGIKTLTYTLPAGVDPGANYTVDFTKTWQQVTPTGNITLASGNLGKGREVTLFIFPNVGGSPSSYTITYPVGWTIAGLWGSSTVFANRPMILKLYSRSNNDASVIGGLTIYTVATDFESYQQKAPVVHGLTASGTNVNVDFNYRFQDITLNNNAGYLISGANNAPGLMSTLLIFNSTGSNIPLFYDSNWGTPVCPLDAAGGNSCTNLGPNRRAVLKVWNLNSANSGVTAEYTHQN